MAFHFLKLAICFGDFSSVLVSDLVAIDNFSYFSQENVATLRLQGPRDFLFLKSTIQGFFYKVKKTKRIQLLPYQDFYKAKNPKASR